MRDRADEFDPRTINFVYDKQGNNGKSTLACLFALHGKGLDFPPINDARELIEPGCDILMTKNLRMLGTLFMDNMPRAMDKRQLGGLYTSIEQIKKGKIYDTRYRYREWWFDSPQIWIFGNIHPDLSLMSADRWRLWTIVDHQLVKWQEKWEDDPDDPLT